MAEHTPFAVTADVVLLAERGGHDHVLLVRRGGEPFAGRWALPGGFTEGDEDVAVAAHRELREETGMDTAEVVLAQLGAYGAPSRDPRGRVVSVAWWARLPALDGPPTAVTAAAAAVEGADDAASAAWVPVADALAGTGEEAMAFDHALVLADAVARDAAASPGFAIAVRFDLPDAASLAAFDALVADLLPGIAADEPATLAYAVHAVDGAPLARVFHEEYVDRAAHAAHEARPATADFLARVRELVGDGLRAELLVPEGAVRRR